LKHIPELQRITGMGGTAAPKTSWFLAFALAAALTAPALLPGAAAAQDPTPDHDTEAMSLGPPTPWQLGTNAIDGGGELGETIVFLNGIVPVASKHTLLYNSPSVGGRSVAAGGSATGALVDGNTLIIDLDAGSAATVTKYIMGGASQPLAPGQVTVSNNRVISRKAGYGVTSGIIGGVAQPGNGGTADVFANSVLFGNGSSISGAVARVFGGFIRGDDRPGFLLDAFGTVTGNSVIVEDGATLVAGIIAGGYVHGPKETSVVPTGTGSAILNTVIVAEGTAGSFSATNVFGGYVARSRATASGAGSLVERNEVELGKGTVSISVYGGYGSNHAGSTFRGNRVIVTGAATSVGGHVIGGGILFGETNVEVVDNTVTGNAVEMKDGSVLGNVIGGHVTAGKASDNGVALSGGTVGLHLAGSYSGFGAGDVDKSRVLLSGAATVGGNVYGGYSVGGKADGNRVEITGFTGTVGATGTGIYGGYSGAAGAAGSAVGNAVNFRDSAVTKSVYGGFVATGTGPATGNAVSLAGLITLSAGVSLAGGGGGTTGDKVSGNTLTMDRVSISAGSASQSFVDISGFENFNLTVTSQQIAAASSSAPAALIPSTGTIALGTVANNNAAKFNVDVAGSPVLGKGQTILIMSSAAAITGDVESAAMITHGPFVTYGVEALKVGNAVQLGVTDVIVRREAQVFSEVPLAAISFVNRGADALASRTIPGALQSVKGEYGVTPFVNVGYGWHRSETGSHVDVKGFNGDLGVAFGTETGAGPVVAGVFVEYGQGEYDSYSDFAGIPTLHGEGDLSYLGGGAFARLDFDEPGSTHAYLELSSRLGKADIDFKARRFTAETGRETKYDMDASYWGFHAGGGYIIDLNDSGLDGSVDLSAKYFHTRRKGDTFDVEGVRASFGSVTSSRAVAGARLTVNATDLVRTYFGLYFEHEFDGDSAVTFAGRKLPKATIGGSSGIGELGVIVKSPDSFVEFEVGAQGSMGRRDAIAGTLGLRFTF
jgi:hypothetical protein